MLPACVAISSWPLACLFGIFSLTYTGFQVHCHKKAMKIHTCVTFGGHDFELKIRRIRVFSLLFVTTDLKTGVNSLHNLGVHVQLRIGVVYMGMV